MAVSNSIGSKRFISIRNRRSLKGIWHTKLAYSKCILYWFYITRVLLTVELNTSLDLMNNDAREFESPRGLVFVQLVESVFCITVNLVVTH